MEVIRKDNKTTNLVALTNNDMQPLVYLIIQFGNLKKTYPPAAGERAKVGPLCLRECVFNSHPCLQSSLLDELGYKIAFPQNIKAIKL